MYGKITAAKYKENSDFIKKQVKDNRQKLKEEVLSHYSPELKCKRCGFEDIRALSIDHTNGSGCLHRRTLKKCGGTEFYRWLKKNNYPTEFQVLCMNCQFIKRSENNEYTKNQNRYSKSLTITVT